MTQQKVSPWGFFGLGAMACLFFLDLGTAGIAPWQASAGLAVLWLVLLVVSMRWFMPHPGWVPWLAAFGFAVWLSTILVGTMSLGWRG